MRKITVILGLILCAILVEGIAFFLSSRIPEEPETSQEEASPSSTFEEMLASALTYKEQRRFGMASEFVRLALDRAETAQERVVAGHQMGELLFEDYRHGGDSRPEAAALYLQAAYDECTPESGKWLSVGLVLLDVLEAMEDTEQFNEYLNEMISISRTPDGIIKLWERKFDYLMDSQGGWREMNEALVVAEVLPLQSEEWAGLIADMQLRSREMLLADESWIEPHALAEEGTGVSDHRMNVFAEIRSKLEEVIENGEEQKQEEALLRLANAMVAVEKYAEAQLCLTQFIERDPKENLTEALTLFSRISRVQGEVAYAAQLAESLIRRFDFNAHTQEEILHVVELLEEHELYEDALGLLEGCFSQVETPGKEFGKLIGRAVMLEERLGHHANALSYMNQLYDLDVEKVFEEILSELINLNMVQGNYDSVETWTVRFISKLSSSSEAYGNALFSLFEAKYWLDQPVLEQLFVGSAAIQHIPEDPRVASVELRMARYIEGMKLHDLAISYFNRIGLLNFFQGDSLDTAFSQNIGEQAMLGKARCLKKLEDWGAADHLYRELCNRTKSPLVKSEAAVGWAELALHFGQNREAMRRYDMAYVQMLSGADQVRYALGRSRLKGVGQVADSASIEETLSLLVSLPEEEQRNATISFFNEAFGNIHETGDERAMLRLIDLAYQSDYAEWLPIQSYVLRLYEDKFHGEKFAGLGRALREKDEVADASLAALSEVVDKLVTLSDAVEKHRKKAIQ